MSASTFRFLQGMLEMPTTGNVSPVLTQIGGPVA